MIETILPEPVVVVDTREDWQGVRLAPEEETRIARAVPSRRREFSTTRECARQALEHLGMPRSPIPAGSRGEPHWPEGVIGSITHCRGYRACAVATTLDIATLGIDAEPHAELKNGILEVIATPEEQHRLAELHRSEPAVHWDRLLFSAKEAVYKAWFPFAERSLDFEDAVVVIDPITHSFDAHLTSPWPVFERHALPSIQGRWTVSDGLVLAAVALSRRNGDASGESVGKDTDQLASSRNPSVQ